MCKFTVYKLYSEQYCFRFLFTTINSNRRRIANQLLTIATAKILNDNDVNLMKFHQEYTDFTGCFYI